MTLPPVLTEWIEANGWQLRGHQREMLVAAQAGEDALLIAPTGSGKTMAGFLPTLADLVSAGGEGLHTLYVSPLKALAVDIRRNLIGPIDEMGLSISVETRSGDTPSDRKARQRARPPHILLTTPESLSLLLSYPDSATLFASLKTVIIDEVHAFATQKRGDLLSLSLARLETIAPTMRRVALSATVAEPAAYARWMSSRPVRIVYGDAGAAPDIDILTPTGEVPWGGHSGAWAIPQLITEIARHQSTIIFCNTRGLAELVFQKLWDANEATLPIGIHHGSLDIAARRKVEAAMAAGRLRALVATASLDLGVDWGHVDCVIQMGAPKGASRLLQRIGRANHRLDVSSKAIIVPGNRFEYLEAIAALDAIADGARDGDPFRPGGLDVLAQHLMACACAQPFDESAQYEETIRAGPYADLDRASFARLLMLVATGGYALKAYDRYRRLVKTDDGRWRVTHPRFAAQHRLNAGIIVDAPMMGVRFRNGRRLGMLDEYFAAALTSGDRFYFAGLALEVESHDSVDVIVRATSKRAQIPSYMGARMPLTTHLADRVRQLIADRSAWLRFPGDVRLWLDMQARRSILPHPDQLLVETFIRDGLHYMVTYSFEGWNAHQSLAMLITKRMDARGLGPVGYVASDYAFAIWSLSPVTDPQALFSADILAGEFVAWVENSALLKRAFREVAIISGLVERQQPGQRKTGRQMSVSTDLIYDVLRRYEPDHILIEAAWADARARMTDVGRLGALLERAAATMVHKQLSHISPLAVPVLVLIGRERVAAEDTEDQMLAEAAALISEAMGA